MLAFISTPLIEFELLKQKVRNNKSSHINLKFKYSLSLIRNDTFFNY